MRETMYVMPCSLVDCSSFFSALNKERARCMILGFRHEADENRALLEYYAASSGNFLPTFRDDLPVLSVP